MATSQTPRCYPTISRNLAHRDRAFTKKIGAPLFARLLTLFIGAICGIQTTRLCIEHLGVSGLSAVVLLSSIGLLVPYADLGAGAAVVNATADRSSTSDDPYTALLAAAFQITTLSATILLLLGIIASASSTWPGLLGAGTNALPENSLVYPFACLIVSLSVPLGLSARILQGAQRVVLLTLIQGFIPVINLTLLHVAVRQESALLLACLAPIFSVLAGAILCTIAALRLGMVPLGLLAKFRVRRREVHRIVRTAAPFTVITVLLTIAFQTDRIILSHYSDSHQLALYGAIFPVMAAALSTVSVIGQILWPHYRDALGRQQLELSSLNRDIRVTGAISVAVGVCAGASLPAYLQLATNGSLSSPTGLPFVLGALVAVQGLHQPAANLLTDPRGLRFSAVVAIPTALSSVTVSCLLAPALGATSVILGSLLAVGVIQAPITYIRARHMLSVYKVKSESRSRTDHPTLQEIKERSAL